MVDFLRYRPVRALAGAAFWTWVVGASPVWAAPLLGSDLASFAVLGASTVTNIPTSTVVGSVGVSPGSAITGFLSVGGVATADPQVTGGTVQATTAVAGQAHIELNNAIVNLGLLGPGTLLSGDLVGLTILPGVYSVPASVSNLTGAVTLDGQGNANAVWVFLFDSTLITSSGSVVNVINTGSGAGLYWDVGSSATLGTTTSFQGNILANQSITFNTGATIGCGRALAENGAVTMDQNTIGTGCYPGTGGQGTNGFSGGLSVATGASGERPTFLPFKSVDSIPEPEALTVLVSGLLGLALALGSIRSVGSRK